MMAVDEKKRDLKWVKDTLQAAIDLELSTIPPYLCALWDIREPREHQVSGRISGVVLDEMFHMGLVCNILTGLGGTPDIVGAARRMNYPMALPGNVHPGHKVHLGGLSSEALKDFMKIEEPENPLAVLSSKPTIGKFYDGIADALRDLTPVPEIRTAKQQAVNIGANELKVLNNLDAVLNAIKVIKEQGEGTEKLPNDPHNKGELAHYYRFGEIAAGKTLRLVSRDPDKWEFVGDRIRWPETHGMDRMTQRRWPKPDDKTAAALDKFNDAYAAMLGALQKAWAEGSSDALQKSIDVMRDMAGLATEIMKIRLPGSTIRSYGPEFFLKP
ncbi:hypothetical protein AV521_23650 [Streptomyces sp. IMTB 2501]|nr:hypothetical protein AV521_23650 [Streptomyces sp. IMTB 2501]